MTKKKSGKTMRLAGLLLVLVLVTSCFVGGTFAKYVTSGEATDTARVAKFGVEITTGTNTMFKTAYTKDDTSTTSASITNSVESTDKVVAPGTKGEMAKMTLTGKPEVAVHVSYAATLKLEGWTVNTTEEYCPIVFTVAGTKYKIGDTGITNVSDLKSKVEAAIKDYSKNYAAGTDLSTVGAESLAISWEWPFETGADDSAKAANNVKDTALGNATTPATIELSVTTTVTQID